MKNSCCTICGNEFEPREGKLYCSDKCKQYAYSSKKNNSTPNTKDKEIIPVKEFKPRYKIDYNEYKKFKQMLVNNDKTKEAKYINIYFYAFYRKNLSGLPDIEFIYDYILDAYSRDFETIEYITNKESNSYDPLFYESYIKTFKDRYDKFMGLYYDGEVEITNSYDDINNL